MLRPTVFVNMASSIDGKITTRGREAFSLGSGEDRAMMEALRVRADAVLIGASTVREEDPPILVRDPERRRERIDRKGSAHPLNVVVSGSLDLPVAGSRFFTCEETERLVYTSDGAAADRAAQVARHARLVQVSTGGLGRPDPRAVLSDLYRRGVREVLLEGGGALNYSMLEAGLVDEIFLTLCPLVIGGASAPTSFEGRGFDRDAIRGLALLSSRVNAHGELFLHYRVERAAAALAAA